MLKGPPRVVIEEYVKGKESIGQDDIEHLAKICFLSLEDAEACAEHHMDICQRRRQVQQKRQRKTRRNQDDKNCQVDGQEETVYCICRRGEEGFMTQCSDCNEWLHGECVRVTEQPDADQIEDYFCDTCLEAAVEPR